MIAPALFYCQFYSWKNRLVMRLRRLRQPKYLFGGIVGALYFYFYMFRAFHRGNGAGATGIFGADHRDLVESIAALAALIITLLSWVLPHSRAALVFTEAETAFLFPAPVSRRELIDFKLLRSQVAILFSSLFISLIGRWGSGHFFIHLLGWWALLSFHNLHLMGSSFTLTMMLDRGISNTRRRLIFLGGAAAGLAIIALWLKRTLPPLPGLERAGAPMGPALAHYATAALQSGPLPWALFPFKLLVAPFFAADSRAFLTAFPPALGLIALAYFWVIHCDVAFEEASLDRSRKVAERVAAVRSGNWQATSSKARKPSRPPFALGPTGFPPVALLWKNLIAAGNLVTARFWVMLLWMAIFGAFSVKATAGRQGAGVALSFMADLFVIFSLFSGPQLLRNDFRLDLPAADVLKKYPLPGWQVVLGEVLAPTLMLAAVQWLLLLVGLILSPDNIMQHHVALGIRLGVTLAAAIVLPAIDFIALLIPNGAALIVPAWFQLGKDGPRGFETTGQQLILMFGQLLALAVSLLPAALAAVGVFAAVSYVAGPAPALGVGAVAAAVVLAAEAALAVRLLGGVFERFDLSSETLTVN